MFLGGYSQIEPTECDISGPYTKVQYYFGSREKKLGEITIQVMTAGRVSTGCGSMELKLQIFAKGYIEHF